MISETEETGQERSAGKVKFEWRPAKAEYNLNWHGISFEEASTVFDDPLAEIVPDLSHSEEESRFICMGTSGQGSLLVVVFTERSDNIRLISAREATPKERRHYETYGDFA
jgi:uncharacterized protein